MSTERSILLDSINETIRFELRGSGTALARKPIGPDGWHVFPCCDCGYIVSGRVKFRMRDGTTCAARSGDSFVLLPGIQYRYVIRPVAGGGAEDEGPRVEVIWTQTNFLLLHSVSVFSLLDVPVVIRDADSKSIGQINRQLVALQDPDRSPSLHRIARQKELGFRFLSVLTRVGKLRTDRLPRLRALRRLAPVFQFLSSNLGSTLSRDSLAELANLSPTRFHTIFKRAMGVAPVHYVQKMRMRMAMNVLLATDLPIAEVASQVGFNDPFHFSRIFRKNSGISPSEYRARGLHPFGG
ncbi:MAG: helix-turn-helix domain-containing protein [Kiritimatiellae bacterium]|nr:helix-turn-helix domain-containing protein [Kiritimatiellia bacterium]